MLTYIDLAENKIFDEILNNSNDGINVVDTNGILVFTNDVSSEYAGIPKEEMIGKHISLFYPDAVLLNVLRNKEPTLEKKIHYIKEKKYIVNSYPLYIKGIFSGAYSIFKDIQILDELHDKVKYLELQLKISSIEKNPMAIIGNSGSLKDVLIKSKRTIGSLGGPRHSIIIGESGTGKTMLANLIYDYGKNIGVLDKNAPFIEVNCAQFTNSDIAAVEIFGSEEGAYTGSKKKRGLFEQASGGVLFLDEAHALEHYQNLILKAVESGKIRRIGSNKEISVNVIIIAASTRNLKEELLPELYQRLAQYELVLPSLRERSNEEKKALFNHFVEKYEIAVRNFHKINYTVIFSDEAKNILLSASYPRNIRQMRDVINYSIDAASPLVDDIEGEEEIIVEVTKNHLPFEVVDDISNFSNKVKSEIDNECKILIDKYSLNGMGA